MTWALVEVRGGVAEVDCDPEVKCLTIDWDWIIDDDVYAEATRALVVASELPANRKTIILDTIDEIWDNSYLFDEDVVFDSSKEDIA